MQTVSLIDARQILGQEIAGTWTAYDELQAARDAFPAKVKAGTATPTDLLRFILLIDACGFETIPVSMGMRWIAENPEPFLQIVGDADIFLESVVRLYDRAEGNPQEKNEGVRLSSHWFFRSFLISPELLRLLSPEGRTRCVRDLYPRFGATNNEWVRAAAMAGVSRATMAEALLERLRGTRIEPGMANDVHDFLRYGIERPEDASPIAMTVRRLGIEHGRNGRHDELVRAPDKAWPSIEKTVAEQNARMDAGLPPNVPFHFVLEFPPHARPTAAEKWTAAFCGLNPWSVLTNRELETALLLCAEKAPGETVKARARILRRLDAAAADIIVGDALDRLDSVSDVPADEWARLSVDQRTRFAERLAAVEKDFLVKPTAQFLFTLLLELPPEERHGFYAKTVSRVLLSANASKVYVAWRQLGREDDGLEKALRRHLQLAGYRLGTIVRRRHPKGGFQQAVEDGKTLYVQERGNHRYFPRDGDVVLFHPNGRHLTPSVVAVTFVPAMADAE